jgi:putative transposase
MPSTHVRLIYHLIFSTKSRHPWIKDSWESRLYSYLGGIVRGLGGVAEALGGTPDHVHILSSLKATHCIADVMREIKSVSSRWIHDEIQKPLFSWQDGYGAFTVSNHDIESIKRYIYGQKEHHKKRTFQEEYIELLKQSGIEFDERFLW